MKLFQLLKLGHADFKAQRKTVILSVLAASIPLLLVAGLIFVVNGLEQTFTRQASLPTDGKVYLLLKTSSGHIDDIVQQHDGKVLQEISTEEVLAQNNIRDYLAEQAGIAARFEKVESTTNYTPEEKKFNPLDLLLTNVFAPYPDNYYQAYFSDASEETRFWLAQFPTPAAAYQYQQAINERNLKIYISEPFSNLLDIYDNFRRSAGLLQILLWAVLAISAVILLATYVYLLDQNYHGMIIYRALGGTTSDLAVISLGSLLEVGLCITVVSLLGGALLALLATLLNGGYISELLVEFYGSAPDIPLLLGFGSGLIWLVLIIFLAAPVSLLLMLDQFSVNNLMKKLKRDQTMLQ